MPAKTRKQRRGRKARAAEARAAKTTRTGPILIAGIILLAAFLRFHDLDNAPPGLCFDEAMNGVNAIEKGDWRVFYPDNHGREGLLINVQAVFLWVFQQASGPAQSFTVEPWMLRFPSALFGTLTVVGLFLLTRSLTGSLFTATAAAFLLATSFWHINFSRIGFRAILSPFCLVFALWLLVEGFRRLLHGGKRAWVALVAAGVCYGAGFHSYIAYRITPLVVLAVLVWFFIEYRKTERLREWTLASAGFLVAALLVCTPLLLYFSEHPESFAGRSQQLSVFSSATPWSDLAENTWNTALMFNISGDTFWRHNVAGRPQIFLPAGLLFLCGTALAVVRFKTAVLTYTLALVWLLAGMVPAVMSNEHTPHALRSLLTAPPSFLLAALAAHWLWLWAVARFSAKRASYGVALLAAVLTGEAYRTYFVTFADSPELQTAFEVTWTELAREVNAQPRGAPKYLLTPGAKLDERGIPGEMHAFALLTGSHSEAGRSRRNIRYVVARDEAGRIAKQPGALAWLLQ